MQIDRVDNLLGAAVSLNPSAALYTASTVMH